jgi:hypothetical protein
MEGWAWPVANTAYLGHVGLFFCMGGFKPAPCVHPQNSQRLSERYRAFCPFCILDCERQTQKHATEIGQCIPPAACTSNTSRYASDKISRAALNPVGSMRIKAGHQPRIKMDIANKRLCGSGGKASSGKARADRAARASCRSGCSSRLFRPR